MQIITNGHKKINKFSYKKNNCFHRSNVCPLVQVKSEKDDIKATVNSR